MSRFQCPLFRRKSDAQSGCGTCFLPFVPNSDYQSPPVLLGGVVHLIPVDPVAGEYRHCTNELPAGVEHEQPRPARLHHVLEALPQSLPAVLPAAHVLVGGRPVPTILGQTAYLSVLSAVFASSSRRHRASECFELEFSRERRYIGNRGGRRCCQAKVVREMSADIQVTYDTRDLCGVVTASWGVMVCWE